MDQWGGWWRTPLAVGVGVLLAIVIDRLTEYFTGTEASPVREIKKGADTGPATLILQGISVGFESSVWSAIVIALTISASIGIFGTIPGLDPAQRVTFILYGVAMTGIGMLTLTGNNVAMDSEQDWAPLRAPFDAPTGASPLTVSLVPFFRQTISATQCAARGGQASTHGPPLSLTSCNPPGFTPGTIAKFGAQATGSAQIAIVPGDLTTTADEADVSLTVNLSDVHSGSATGVDYDPNPSGADASLIFLFRLTDTLNGPASSTPATVTDSTISTPVTCTSTAGSLGSNCAAATTADAVMPGFVKEGKSMSIQVFGVRLLDSGSNGVRGDSDDKLFAFQGIYVP